MPSGTGANAIDRTLDEAGEALDDALDSLKGLAGGGEAFAPPTPGEIAAISAAIVAALIAAGVAVSLAQAIAAAIANALQAGIELTAEEINEAIVQALGWSASRDEPEPERAAEQPPRPAPKPPTIIDPKARKPFATNDQGQYWAPDEKGNWRWLSEKEAREAARALGREAAQRQRERAHHERETERDLDASREKIRRENEAERTRIAEEMRRSAENARADEERREKLLRAVQNTITELDDGERQGAYMEALADQLQRGDTEGAQLLWDHLRGDRQSQIDATLRDAQWEAAKGKVWSAGETAATVAREGSKTLLAAGAAMASGGGSLGGAAVVTGGLTAIGGAEGGVRYDASRDEVGFDEWEAAKGAVRGAKAGMEASIGGIKTQGRAAVAFGKMFTRSALEAAETYADTGDAGKAVAAGLLSAGGDLTGEVLDQRNVGGWQQAAAESSANMLESTARGVVVEDKDLNTALGDAVTGEVKSRLAKGLLNRATKSPHYTGIAGERAPAADSGNAAKQATEARVADEGQWARLDPGILNKSKITDEIKHAEAQPDFTQRQHAPSPVREIDTNLRESLDPAKSAKNQEEYRVRRAPEEAAQHGEAVEPGAPESKSTEGTNESRSKSTPSPDDEMGAGSKDPGGLETFDPNAEGRFNMDEYEQRQTLADPKSKWRDPTLKNSELGVEQKDCAQACARRAVQRVLGLGHLEADEQALVAFEAHRKGVDGGIQPARLGEMISSIPKAEATPILQAVTSRQPDAIMRELADRLQKNSETAIVLDLSGKDIRHAVVLEGFGPNGELLLWDPAASAGLRIPPEDVQFGATNVDPSKVGKDKVHINLSNSVIVQRKVAG